MKPDQHAGLLQRLQAMLREELRQLTLVQSSDRVWQMPFAAALASGFPLLVGAYFGRLDYGLISSLGGMVFLYLPGTPLYHRMILVMACAFGMAASFTLGVMSHFFPPLMVPALIFTTILVTMVCRFYGLGPPGSLFFIMAASLGAYSPTDAGQLPLMVGLITMGSLQACLIAFFYSVYIVRRQTPKPVPPLPAPSFDFVVFDSVVIGVFVGIALALAQALQLERAYWVPVSCLAVIQGASLRAVWTRQLHRVLGTSLGLLLAWGLLLLPLNEWTLALIMMALSFIIESIVVRHYALATVFITPLTLLIAEAATFGQGVPAVLIQARFVDTLLGCFIGLVGGMCLHSGRFREMVGKPLRRLIPGA
ncbi:Fusaric acid resistance protein-like [Noviherbaspirillum humi]|uniref:Fusaric acid resistance protein-like n=1 Tax=Noviherbaspirillum humi TaxID=1688639 RepID=A0A239J3H9_9BURK|nr:FUSC family protein [Noviherbaspirillum humi]SNS99823.1 Fusaric acid resistance protein-like [Noviherbaspirillum humi]